MLKKDLHYLIDKYLSNEIVVKSRVVRPEKVKQLLTRFEEGEDFLYNRIWALILLHKWMNDHAVN